MRAIPSSALHYQSVNLQTPALLMFLFFSLAFPSPMLAQTADVGVKPDYYALIGTWTVVPMLEITAPLGAVTITGDQAENAGTITFVDGGAGTVSTAGNAVPFVWQYDPATGIISIAYVGYQSELYVRQMGKDQLLVVEKQLAKAFVVAFVRTE